MRLVPLLALLLMQQAPFIEQIEVRIHNVDVVVTDKAGNAVEGLRRDDFELLEDGKPQAITNFSAYSSGAAPASGAETTAAAEAAATPQVPPVRKIVFFVDEMSIMEQVRNSLSKNASEMLDRTMRPGDEAIALRPADLGNKVSFDFTTDRDAVKTALTNAIGAQTYRANVAFEGEWRLFRNEAQHAGSRQELNQIARRHAAGVRQRVENRLTTLRAALAIMAPMPGRKVFVAITESLAAFPGREFFTRGLDGYQVQMDANTQNFDAPGDFVNARFYADLRPMIEEIARIASSNGITIYAIQPELDRRIDAGGGVENRKPSAPNIGEVQYATDNTAETMNILTGKTGGKWLTGAAHANEVLRTIERDVASYYSLAYHGGDDFDQPHKVQVRVRNHPEYNIRARNEVTRKSAPREMTDRVVAALVTTNVPNELGIAVRANPPVKEKRGGYNVDVDVGVLIGRLLLLRDGNQYRGKFTVHYAVSASKADFVSGMDPEQVVEIPIADFEAAKSKWWRHTLHMKMSPGEHHIAVGVLDGIAQRSGMATLKVDIQ